MGKNVFEAAFSDIQYWKRSNTAENVTSNKIFKIGTPKIEVPSYTPW